MSKDLFLEEFIRRIGAFGWEDGAKYVTIDRYAALTTPILESVLRDRIRTINQEELGKLPSPSRDKAVDEALTRLKNEVDLVQILDFIRRGVPVTVGTGRGSASLILKVIDYENLSNNKFFYLRRVRFREVGGSIIEPDFILYVNGIPIVVVEIRNKNRIGSYREALEKLRRYEEDAPSLFKYVQLGLAIGDDEFYRPTLPGYIKSRRDAYRWVVKETSRSDVTRLLEPRVLLDFLRYYIQYVVDEKGVLTKIVARYNQYNATEAVMRRSEEHLKRPGGKNAGLVWHWLGSGKTFTMFFSALKFLDRYYDKSPIVFIVVDRTELEDQIGRVLRAIRDQRFKLLFQRVESIEQLHDILRTIKRAELDPKIVLQPKVYLVTIQKFMRGSEEVAGIESLLTELGNMYLEYLKTNDTKQYGMIVAELEELNEKSRRRRILELGSIKHRHILVLIDEAHRSQYGILATMLKMAMPNALRIGFTGTPVMKFDRNTFREFAYPEQGELYLDVYSIGDSIRDGFTVPITYHVVNSAIKINVSEDDIRQVVRELEEALNEGIDPEDLFEKVDEMYRGINSVRVILSNPQRICDVARYIVHRLEQDLGDNPEASPFKAMVVAVNRLACVYYKRCLDEFLQQRYGEKAKGWVEVVMSYGGDDPKDIRDYKNELRERFPKLSYDEINQEIVRRFREDETPKILVVTEMLLAGFDAPNLKVLYLDKPLIGHRLLQALARVNRPFKVVTEDGEVEIKGSGLIVDFIGLIKHLVETQALYEALARENPQNVKFDFINNALDNIDSLFNKFMVSLNDVKEKLRDLTLLDRHVGVDIEKLKELDAVTLRNYLSELASFIALAASGAGGEVDVNIAGSLLNKISEVIGMYRALGAYPRKLDFEDDLKILKVLYGLVMIMMRRGDVELDIAYVREKLYNLIYDKTVVEEISEIAVMTHEELSKILESGTKATDSVQMERRVTSSFLATWLQVRNRIKPYLERDPIYKQIYMKLLDLINEWIARSINVVEAYRRLKDLVAQLEDYEKRAAAQPPSVKVAYALSRYLSSKYLGGREVNLKLSMSREVIDKVAEDVSKFGAFSQYQITEIRKAVLIDIFTELKDVLSLDAKRDLSMTMDRIFDDLIRPYIENYIKTSTTH